MREFRGAHVERGGTAGDPISEVSERIERECAQCALQSSDGQRSTFRVALVAPLSCAYRARDDGVALVAHLSATALDQKRVAPPLLRPGKCVQGQAVVQLDLAVLGALLKSSSKICFHIFYRSGHQRGFLSQQQLASFDRVACDIGQPEARNG